MTGDPFGWVRARAGEREAAGLRRRLVPRDPGDGGLLDLASNDYLGLARDPRVVEGAVRAARTWGAGATGSRLVTGSTELHARLEHRLAAVTGAGAGLVFSSGYLANLAAVAALTGPGALVVSDAHVHASLVDACRLSRARVVVVAHRSPEAVAAALAARSEERALVVTDGVFSVDGETAPLAELAAVCRTHRAGLLVDDAHALGVVGEGGAGSVAAAGLAGAVDVVVTVTLSKALGAQGGAVLAHPDVLAHLVDTARPFIFDTGLAPACAGAAVAALDVLAAEPDLPARARSVARSLAALATASGFEVAPPQAAVVGVRVGGPAAALAAAERCRAHGVRVGCFRPPSVPDGVSRLRLTARSSLGDEELRRVERALSAAAGRTA